MAGKWPDDDKRKIFEAFSILAVSMKSYGNMDHKTRLRAWQAILEDDMNADEICEALYFHAKTNDEIPTPAQIRKYKFPEVPIISHAELIHAKEQHKLQGYPAFGYYGQIIKDYEKQEADGRDIPKQRQAMKDLISPKIIERLQYDPRD